MRIRNIVPCRASSSPEMRDSGRGETQGIDYTVEV